MASSIQTFSEQEIAEHEAKLMSGKRYLLSIFICPVTASILTSIFPVTRTFGYFIGAVLFFLIDYWIPPRPRRSFLNWFLKVVVHATEIMLGLWLMPLFLSRLVWPPLAYGLSALILCFSLYWASPLYPKRNSVSLKKWLIVSALFTLLWAGIGWFSPFEW